MQRAVREPGTLGPADAKACQQTRESPFHPIAWPDGGIKLSDESGNPCPDLNAQVLRLLSASPQMDTVILAARWAYYERGTGYGVDGSEKRRLLVLAGSKIVAPTSTLFSRTLSHARCASFSLQKGRS